MLLLLALACAEAPPRAAEIPYGDSNVQETLDRLVAAHEARLQSPSGGGDEPTSAEQRLTLLEDRLGKVELAIQVLQNEGIVPASSVSYDPRATKLGGKTLQTAMDEVEKRVALMESKVNVEDMGQAGSGLFEIRDQGGQRGPGGQGSRQGGPGGPGGPGGQGGPGGGQGGQGGPGGGQRGGGQGGGPGGGQGGGGQGGGPGGQRGGGG